MWQCHSGQRLRELAGVLDERLHLAKGEGAGGHPQATDHGDHHVVQVPEEHHRGHDQPRDELRPEADPVELVVLLAERLLDLGLPSEHLHQ